MVSSKTPSNLKRKAEAEERGLHRDVSPPATKKKFLSTTTQDSVATFFKPLSQKDPEKTIWRVVGNSLLVAEYQIENASKSKRRRIAGFDLDSTLIAPKSGNKFAKDEFDWKWWHPCVPGKLRELHDEGRQIVLFSNQSGLNLSCDSKTIKMDRKKVTTFKTKVNSVLNQLDIPTIFYAATEQDLYRKPRLGMWKEMIEDIDLDVGEGVDLQHSMFVGDAGGRVAGFNFIKDHASSDRDFAANVGINFQSPEAFFLRETERDFTRIFDPHFYLDTTNSTGQRFLRTNKIDLVIMCGSPGSGKSTFYWTHLAPLGYERVNQDTLKTRDKCLAKATQSLSRKTSVAVDNTNADAATRAHWIELGKRFDIPVRCVLLKADPALCEHNDKVRALNGSMMNPESREMLPRLAFHTFTSRFQEPRLEEGLQDIVVVDFEFQGTSEQREIWSKYWI